MYLQGTTSLLKLHLERKSALIIYNPSSVSSTFGSAPANLTNYFCGQRQKAMRLKQLGGGNPCLEDFKCYLGEPSGKKKRFSDRTDYCFVENITR